MVYHCYSAACFVGVAFLLISQCQLKAENGGKMSTDALVDMMEEEDKSMDAMKTMIMLMDKEVKCLGIPNKIFKYIKDVFEPLSEDYVMVTFYLTTRKVRKWMQIPTKPGISFKGLDFEANRLRTIFIVHGFLSRAKTAGWVEEMANALLDWSDVNVIIVDWQSSWRYWRAVGNTRLVGKAMTELGLYLMGVLKTDTMKFHLIGHSLGAHIVSFMAGCLGGVARITGLDPAGPCFQGDDFDNKLDITDAKFVDIIHTNGRLMEKLGFGQSEPIGHVDFYPNGGMTQPGCSKKSFLSNIPYIFSKFKRAICSHGRAHQFFLEGIRHNCSFWGHLWNREEDTRDMAETNFSSCTLETCTEMGMLTEEFPARGSFIVTTKEKVPFCRPDSMLDQRMGRLLGTTNRLRLATTSP